MLSLHSSEIGKYHDLYSSRVYDLAGQGEVDFPFVLYSVCITIYKYMDAKVNQTGTILSIFWN